MSYGSGDNYSYDGSNQGGYTGYGEDSTPQYGYDNFNQGYDQVDGGVGNSNPFDNFAPVSGGADSGTPVSGGGVADSNPFGNFDAGEDIAGGFSNVSVGSGGGGGGGGGGFGDQYEVFGSGNNNQFDQGLFCWYFWSLFGRFWDCWVIVLFVGLVVGCWLLVVGWLFGWLVWLVWLDDQLLIGSWL